MPRQWKTARIPSYALLLLTLVGCAGVGGESVHIKTSVIPQSQSPKAETVFLLNEAEDRRPGDRLGIGKSTWSLLKIKHGSITSKEPLLRALVRIVKEELESSSYSVNLIDQTTTAGEPFLRVFIEQFAFEMWSYFWPYIKIDGTINLSLAIETPEGKTLQSKFFSGSHETSCWFGGCSANIEDTIDASLMKIRLELQQWFNSKPFQEAWKSQ